MKNITFFINEINAGSLIFENISKKELNDILNNKYLTDNEKKLDELFNKYNKLKEEFDNKSKKLLLNKEYDKASNLIIKWNEVAKSINEEIKKLSDIVSKDRNIKHNKYSIFLLLVNIYEFVSSSIKNIDDKYVQTIINNFGEDGIDTYIFGPVRIYINNIFKQLNPLIKINIEKTSNNDILSDIENVIKYLKLDFLKIKDNVVKWNPQNIQSLVDKLSGRKIEKIENLNDLLNDDEELNVIKK